MQKKVYICSQTLFDQGLCGISQVDQVILVPLRNKTLTTPLFASLEPNTGSGQYTITQKGKEKRKISKVKKKEKREMKKEKEK